MEGASVQFDSPDQHIRKKTKTADTTPNPEGSGLNTESPSDQHISNGNKMADTTPNPQGIELSSELERVKNAKSPLEHSAQLLVDRPKEPIVWEVRCVLVEEHEIDLEKELDFVGGLVECDSRNYLIWQYRRWVLEKLGSEAARKELEFTKKILSKDAKIYQAWSHREWIIQRFDGSLWLAELQYCHEVLQKDIFNIFAWDQRCRGARSIPNMEKAFRDTEAIYAREAIAAQPGNEGPWIYLKCLYLKAHSALYRERDLECIYEDVLANEADRVEAAVELEGVDRGYNVVDAIVDKRACVHALNLILDLIFLDYKGSERLLRAVDVLNENCGHFESRVYPEWIKSESEVLRKVCSLAVSLDAKRICFSSNYYGAPRFSALHCQYLINLRKELASLQ